jgi:hypothetical protein
MDKVDIGKRVAAAVFAACGVIVAATGPIDWSNPQFLAGLVMTILPALYSTGDNIFGAKK